jgi:glycine betaine/proline transport system substrate-binding protein
MNASPIFEKSCALAVGLLLLQGAASYAETLPGAGRTVTPGRPTWDTGYFYVEIYDRAVAALGYAVKPPVTLENPAFYSALGQGDVDFWVETDVPLHNVYLDKIKGQYDLVGNVAKGELQGYVVDKKTAEALHIETLDDFKRPEVVKAFDENGTGKAQLVACPPGWGCELVIDHQIDAYGLKNFVEPIKASYSASMADAVAKYKTGKPLFAYIWSPSWMAAMLKPGTDVVWIEVPFPSLPADQKAAEPTTFVKGVVGCVENHDPCKIGWAPFDVRPIGNVKFLNDNPAIKKLFEVMTIPTADISAENLKMYQGEKNQPDIDKHATDWIKAHQQQFDQWIAEAKSAAAK